MDMKEMIIVIVEERVIPKMVAGLENNLEID